VDDAGKIRPLLAITQFRLAAAVQYNPAMKRALMTLGIAAMLGPFAEAQVGPTRARPINGATKALPMMLIDQKSRKVVLDVFVDAQGRVTGSRIVERSGNGVFDERMRGYWKDTKFMPALDRGGLAIDDTLRITNTYTVDEKGSLTLRDLRNRSDIEGNKGADDAARIERMHCRDLVWEYDFMKQRAPKATLAHESIFHVPFAMYLAAGRVNEAARDDLIREWAKLVENVLVECRAKPDATYWKDVFVPVFTRATPYQSAPPE
jgi:TonB family protein